MSEELLIERDRLRRQAIRDAMKGKRYGPGHGRPRKYDYEPIWNLRDQGLTYGQIKRRLNIPRWTVIAALRSRRKQRLEEEKINA
jgi:hypothetical protein